MVNVTNLSLASHSQAKIAWMTHLEHLKGHACPPKRHTSRSLYKFPQKKRFAKPSYMLNVNGMNQVVDGLHTYV